MTALPYLPLGRTIEYVPTENEFMQAAKVAAGRFSTNSSHPTGAVIVKDNQIIGKGGNHSWFHKVFFCIRKLIKAPTGKLYSVCPGCSPATHAEAQAIKQALKYISFQELSGADLYLWGHWWCCEHCWERMIAVEIKNVYLPVGAEKLFRK